MDKKQFETYVRQLCKDKGLDEAKTQKVVDRELANFDGEDGSIFAALVELPIKSSADYNQKVDELKKKAETLDVWHKSADGTYKQAVTKAAEVERVLALYKEKFGDIDSATPNPDGKTATTETGDVIRKSDLLQLLQARDQFHIQRTADLGDIRAKHAAMFKGEIISDRAILIEIEKARADSLNPQELSPQQAYDRLYGDRVKQYETDQAKAHDDNLRAEGAKQERERLARAGMKTGAAVGEAGGIVFSALETEGKKGDPNRQLSDEDRIAALANDMNTEFAKNNAEA